MADRKQGGAEDYARRRQYDYRAVSHNKLHFPSQLKKQKSYLMLELGQGCGMPASAVTAQQPLHMQPVLTDPDSHGRCVLQNSNLVLTAETRTRDATEPSGEPETLWGRFGKTKMGDRVQYSPP